MKRVILSICIFSISYFSVFYVANQSTKEKYEQLQQNREFFYLALKKEHKTNA